MSVPEPIRVGYVVKRYPRYSETFIVNEILAHEAAGVAVEIFALRGPEDTHFQDIISRVRAPVTYLPDRSQKASDLWDSLRETAETCPATWWNLHHAATMEAREVVHALALAAHVRRRGITHLHAHFATSASAVARLAGRIAEVPYSFTAHAKDIFHEDVNQEELAQRIHDAAGVVTVSDYNVSYLGARFPQHADKVRRIYNGLDLDRFAFTPPTDRDRLILSVGRLVEKKGFAHLIDACKLLKDRGEPFQCAIVGSGEEEAALRRRIQAHGLQDQVHLQGSLPQRAVIELMQSAAVFAAPCVVGKDGNRDGLPTVLLEAMALGTPCIATDVTGIPEILRHGHTGLLVAQEQTQPLADAIADLLNDSALAVRLARNARKLMEKNFDVHHNAAQVRELFQRDAVPTPRRIAV